MTLWKIEPPEVVLGSLYLWSFLDGEALGAKERVELADDDRCGVKATRCAGSMGDREVFCLYFVFCIKYYAFFFD